MPAHATLRLDDDSLLCPTPALRRAMTRSIARIGAEGGLIAWAFPDNHGHLAIAAGDAEASRLAWRIELACQAYRPTGAAAFQRRWLRSESNHRYLANMTRYILGQAHHHGITSDPFAESDCRLDLLGLRRVAPWARLRMREQLPRLSDAAICEHLEVRLDDLRDWAAPILVDDGLEQLRAAAIATFALRSFQAKTLLGLRARAAAVHAAPEIPTSRLSAALGIPGGTIRAIRRGEGTVARAMLRHPFEHPDVRAVSAQARWRARTGGGEDSAIG